MAIEYLPKQLDNPQCQSPSFHPQQISADIAKFDDIPTTAGLGPLPSIYNHLSFSSYSALKPRDPALENLITPNDLNCAVSAPNALLGSRLGNGAGVSRNSSKDGSRDPSAAYFFVGNATAMVESGLQPDFSLISFDLKPMDAPPPGTSKFSRPRTPSPIQVNSFNMCFTKRIWGTGDIWGNLKLTDGPSADFM